MNKEQIIKLIWEEYHNAYDGAINSPITSPSHLRYSGHAQCALNLLARLGESTENEHEDMANLFKRDLQMMGVEFQ